MITVVLYEPQIPPNTGNIGRLCAATKARLHIVGKIGFDFEDKKLKRAGLDYWPFLNYKYFEDLKEYHRNLVKSHKFHLLTTKSPHVYTKRKFSDQDFLVFGSETKGIDDSILNDHWEQTCTIPIKNKKIRSFNLANSVSIVLFEALRQINETT
ncbi:MAG: tRNA (uridine(34)/cytosine(34)/5-carboxymethylaminomethyluridine(34)-2'-O)-methyltransferase TrmL [Candidatus Marinimicrobia bacterium]|nr:tRNA (uridine(34)/cytosine(34)/5-carboxymethylaminomethyluridine(34)-2'-O)-methyltransferase TrmL [Candidatus Neomarinimicrobiota bacterium]|tara:strand:- start:2206 stop:2667 length:462 start_codon:yes stop_codon:yes gene_type:complete